MKVESQSSIKQRVMAPFHYLPEKNRPDPEPFVAHFEKIMKRTIENEDGRRSLSHFSVNLAKWVYSNWTPWESDVVVVSYPKTGTTWVSAIAAEIIYKDDPKAMELFKSLRLYKYLSHGIEEKYELLEKLPWKRRLFATHCPEELVNVQNITNAGAKIIFTIRNPKDQLVSLYHMFMNTPYDPATRKQLLGDGWNDFFEKSITGQLPFMLKEKEWYADFLLGWNKHENNKNVLFVVYEDLKQDPSKEIKKIAEFLGVQLSNNELTKVFESTTFQTMKQNATNAEKVESAFRKGEVGNWKEYFTVAQSELMDRLVREKLSGTNIVFTYE